MIATNESTVSARLAVSLLESLDAAGSLPPDADLCLVYAVPGFDDDELPADIRLSESRRWKLARIEGDFALRVALCDAAGTPLLAFTSKHEEAFQADLRERAVMRRTIRPQSRHLFSALVGREATALDDERFGAPLHDVIAGGRRDPLLAAIRQRTWNQTIRESDAIAILCAAAFGFDDRFTEDKPGELWAAWLREPPLRSPALDAFALEVLRTRYPVYERVLSRAPQGDAAAMFRVVAGHAYDGDALLVQLALDTALRLREREPGRLDALLAPLEAAYVAAGSPEVTAPLLRGAFQAAARRLTLRCRSAFPPPTGDIDVLARFLYDDRVLREALVRIARLARGLQALERNEIPTTLKAFAACYRNELAWLDRAARRARESVFVDPEMMRTRDELIDRWYALRDRWNEAFAMTLQVEWETLFAFPGSTAPFVVSQLLKHIVRPKLSSGKTLLVVLDGCDVATFLEILTAFEGTGATATRVELALSAIPTVTSHARRAIFGGDIPGDRIDDDDRAADASGDRKAFEGPNAYLEGYSRKLYLKGDLGDGGAALVAILAAPRNEFDLVAVVFNDVDDAIASKEHGVLPERTLERCTNAFREALLAAVEYKWRVVVTADHGHTPYRQPDRKAATEHARFSLLKPGEAPPVGTVLFERGTGLPFRLAALHAVGTHAGPQHVGYHGGVSLEEMLVPLAFFEPDASREPLLPPAWWDDAVALATTERGVRSADHYGVVRPDVTPNVTDVRVRARAALAGDARLLKMFAAIDDAGFLNATQLAGVMALPQGRVRIFVVGLIDRLQRAGIEPPISIEDEPLVFRWTGPK